MVEALEVMDELANPSSAQLPAFHVVAPSLPGFGFSGKPGTTGWNCDRIADAWALPENAISRDRILDNVMMYWLPAAGGSSARIYWENFPPERSTRVAVPAAVTMFPRDIEKFPRRWVEQRFQDLRYWHVAERGGHFPALEVPELYVREIQQSLPLIAPA